MKINIIYYIIIYININKHIIKAFSINKVVPLKKLLFIIYILNNAIFAKTMLEGSRQIY